VKQLFWISIISLAALISCKQEGEKRVPVARVYDYVLYADELDDIIPDNVHGADSVLYARSYINQWQHRKVVLHYAENNLQEDQMDFSRQVEDYRNSLVIYEYRKRLVEQNLDTVVSMDEIKEYYDRHKQDFTLKRNIVQAVFLKIPNEEKKNIWQVKQLLKTYTDEDKAKLKDIAEHIATNYFLDDNVWLFFDDFVKEVPIKTYNQASFLRNNRVVVERDSVYTYLVRINDFKIADSVSPISFEYDRIRSIIINIRKLKLIEQMEKEMFERAMEEGKVTVTE
jgi:predicted transcriptional regulator